jgi:hypothetical protein
MRIALIGRRRRRGVETASKQATNNNARNISHPMCFLFVDGRLRDMEHGGNNNNNNTDVPNIYLLRG